MSTDNDQIKMSDIIHERIKAYIIQEKMRPGDRLPSERMFANLFNVSRPVIREALRALEHSGIVSIRRGGGAFLQTPDSTQLFTPILEQWHIKENGLLELLELRKVLEQSAVEHAIIHGNKDNVDHLDSLATAMLKAQQIDELKQADVSFHQALLHTTKNQLFMEMSAVIMRYFTQLTIRDIRKHDIQQTVQEHVEIVRAIQNKDTLLAKQCIAAHLDRARITVRSLTRKNE